MQSCGVFGGAKTNRDRTGERGEVSVKPEKVDTVIWRDITEDKGGAITNEPTKEESSESSKESIKKERYTIANIIPFETQRMNLDVENTDEIRNLKYLHYYAGMKMALDDLESEGIQIQLDTWDSKEDDITLNKILSEKLNPETDLILGPVKKDLLITLAEFGKQNEIPVISPWYSSQSVANENPYYIQLTPFLTEHYRALTQHALSHFKPNQIYLVGRQGSRDISRFKYFQEEAYNLTGEENVLNEFIFDIDSLTFEFEIIKRIFLERSSSNGIEEPTVFILPTYSPRESQYIYDIIRRINVEKESNEVYVYGMPLIYSMDKITYDYFTNLNIRIAMSRFPQKSNYDVKAFAAKFFNEYNTFPKDEAFEGYDNLMFVGRMLYKYGTNFKDYLDQDENEYLTTKFNIKPVMEMVEEEEKLDYLENKNLRIIQYRNNEFEIVD